MYSIAVFFILVCGICRGDDPPTEFNATKVVKIMPMSVVRTWGDLLAQKPVQTTTFSRIPTAIGGKMPHSFRLGIDRTHAKLFGGVVVYCLSEGGTGQIGLERPTGFHSLGPFAVDVQRPDDLRQADVARKELASAEDDSKEGHPYTLFMQTLPLDHPGSYTITIGGIASAKVEVSSEWAVLWTPLLDSTSEGEPEAGPGYSVTSVANSSSGAAVPRWPGRRPIFLDRLPDAKSPLPEFIPVDPDADLQLSENGNGLIVKLDQETSSLFPNDNFLTRWWVNGKLFIPKPELSQRTFTNHSGASQLVKEVHFRLDFHPEVLSVKKGDTIGLQLLFCPDGWEYAWQADQAQLTKALSLNSDDGRLPAISRLSNRIDFTYSGDPKNMRQN
jgi:hypothetical protein